MRTWLVVLLLVRGFVCAGACAAEDLAPGLVGEYYKYGHEVTKLEAIPADKKLVVKRVDKNINIEKGNGNFNGTKLSNFILVLWTGKITIETAGKYTFTLQSDDGSRLSIDGKVVVDNNGLHSMEQPKDGATELGAGAHDIKVEYFQADGAYGCNLWWASPSITKQIVPEGVLSHVKGSEK